MTTQLTDGTSTVPLPDDLFWPDEHSWNAVEQSAQRTITGALVVQSAAKVGGRPITLQPPDDSSAWLTRATVDALRNLAAVPGKTLTLTLRGVAYTVMFRQHEGVAIEARPVVFFADEAPGDFYLCTLRLMEL
jgi:hypothetical protein